MGKGWGLSIRYLHSFLGNEKTPKQTRLARNMLPIKNKTSVGNLRSEKNLCQNDYAAVYPAGFASAQIPFRNQPVGHTSKTAVHLLVLQIFNDAIRSVLYIRWFDIENNNFSQAGMACTSRISWRATPNTPNKISRKNPARSSLTQKNTHKLVAMPEQPSNMHGELNSIISRILIFQNLQMGAYATS